MSANDPAQTMANTTIDTNSPADILALAKVRFANQDFRGTVSVCQKISAIDPSPDKRPAFIETYYIWSLACLKLNLLDNVLNICSEARKRFDAYLDLAYFELIAVSASGVVHDVPGLAETYMHLWSLVEKGADPLKNRTFGIAGQVLLMWGQALEQLEAPDSALNIYKKYMLLHPEDKEISDRIVSIESKIAN